MKCPSLKPEFKIYRDILIFMVTVLVANYAWKWTFTGDEYGELVTWLGIDVTAPFEFMALHVARAVYRIVALFRDTVYLVGDNEIRFESGAHTIIIWGCTGLKQAFIWLCIMLTVQGGWKHKLWYIPFGWCCCYIFNILRIVVLALFIEHHPTWFHPLHDYILKYAFYFMFFGLWVLFVEKLKPSSSAN